MKTEKASDFLPYIAMENFHDRTNVQLQLSDCFTCFGIKGILHLLDRITQNILYGRSKKNPKHSNSFQYKLACRNETGTNHHGLLSNLI